MRKFVYKLISLIEKVTNTNINIKIGIHKVKKIKNIPNVSKFCGIYLTLIADYLERLATFKPKNIFEIGANYGQDADFLRNRFNLKNSDVYIFEPHPEIIDEAKKSFSFNCYPFAVSDENKKMTFHAINLKSANSGISSLMNHKFNNESDYFDIEVEAIRMDNFISINKIDEIDFLKVDVEGATYEVLIGFGKELSRVRAIQIEAEYLPVWVGQKTWDDIYSLLSNNGFQLIHFGFNEN